MTRPLPQDERALELLADLASGEAGEAERDELRRLMGDDADRLIEEFELGAAAAELAMVGRVEPMPASVRAKVDAAAVEFLREAAGEAGGSSSLQFRGASSAEPPVVVRGAPMPFAVMGWLVAAACLVVAGVVWMRAAPAPTPPVDTPQQLQAQLDADEGVVRAAWIGVGELPIEGVSDHALDHGVSGEVVWSDREDRGFMRISGVAPNDPSEFQYQLWIFDAERPVGELPQFAVPGLPELLTQRPVDGGVFDIPSEGEVVVPIDAKLPIGAGTIFAVTKERPGGVVVSDREIVFLAIRS